MSDAYDMRIRVRLPPLSCRCESCGAVHDDPGKFWFSIDHDSRTSRQFCESCPSESKFDGAMQWSGYNAVIKP